MIQLESLHPDVSMLEVQENTGFHLIDISPASWAVELRISQFFRDPHSLLKLRRSQLSVG